VYSANTVGQPSGEATFRYTGCGGFILEYGSETVVADPFFSNTGMLRAALCKYQTDTALINDYFREYLGQPRDTEGRISTILISHAHYDHLGDVPALIRNNLQSGNTVVYGSHTMVNLLRSYPGLLPDTARQLVNLEKQFAARSATQGEKREPEVSPFFYTPGRRIRFAAIPSNHAGHYKFFHPQKLPFIGGQIEQPYSRPPRSALRFKEGQNFNYLIDLLNEKGEAVFRIFSNAGAACDAGIGFPPKYLLNEKPVDLLLICGANYNIAENYPFALLEYLNPRMVNVVHWENFFKPIPKLHKRPEVVPNTNIPKLMHLLEDFAGARRFQQVILLEQPLGRVVRFRF